MNTKAEYKQRIMGRSVSTMKWSPRKGENIYMVSSPMPDWQLVLKRAADVVISIIFLPLLVSVYLIVGLALRLESKGPVVFRQPRVGKDGRVFDIYKFRSMYENADEMRTSIEDLNEVTGPVFKIKHDPRVTKVGAVLRRTSIDELPQLINILKGEMSLVGPRPPLCREVAQYNDYQRCRLAVKSGLTCLWQVKGRSNISFEEWVELDVEYIRHQTLLLDLRILILTIPAVLKGSGAW